MRTTIDFGIDLGTTNSSIAVMKSAGVEVFRNNEHSETTPSAVWIDRNGTLVVGRRAYERLDSDPLNAASEFKLGMGTDRRYSFSRGHAPLSSPQLSAEVLKSLKADVRGRTGEDLTAAVITVPAAFELPQSEATQEAARLAGLTLTPLVQEPVAAALAYGHQSTSDKVFWLVYDLGGGTFDAAVVQIRDQEIPVVNHGGDNQLGGKLLDWGIVEELLIPALGDRRLEDFRRGNPKWLSALAKLKVAAEQAKIRLSRDASVDVFIEYLCADDRGEPVSLERQITRSDLDRIAEPLILRSINVCRKVLAERRLSAIDLQKIILVGGPTLMPSLRQQLQDAFQVPLEFERDPLTVVAQGAAIVAATHRLVQPAHRPAPGRYSLDLKDKPAGADLEPLVGGAVSVNGAPPRPGFTIEFVNAEMKPVWRSGRIPLGENGAFITRLWAVPDQLNTFSVELFDETGRQQVVQPNSTTYRHGPVWTPAGAPLTHSVGVALANGDVEWLLEKGVLLPAKRTSILRTTVAVQRGNGEALLAMPVVEGENRRADRNAEIGRLEILADQVKRDIPAGSEVELTIAIDESRIVRTRAYLPILDEEFEKVLSFDEYRRKARDPRELTQELDRQCRRLEEARSAAPSSNQGDPLFERIDRERMIHDVRAGLAAALVDPDAADKAERRLNDLRVAIDEIERTHEWPALVRKAEMEIETGRGLIQDDELKATAEERAAFASLERDIHRAIDSRDVKTLEARILAVGSFGFSIVMRHPGFWVGQLQQMSQMKERMTDPGRAELLVSQGRRAINNNDMEALSISVRQLAALLPDDDTAMTNKLKSTVRVGGPR